MSNVAAGNLSVVIGSYGEALHESSAVLAFNASGDTRCASQGTGTVNICASGGLYLNGVLFTIPTMKALNQTAAGHEAAISQLESRDAMLWANASAQASTLQDHGRTFEDVQATLLQVTENATTVFDWLTVHSKDLEAAETNASVQWSQIVGLQREDLWLWQASQSHDGEIAAMNETVGNHQSAIDSLNHTVTDQQSTIDNLRETMNSTLDSEVAALQSVDSVLQSNVSGLWHDIQDLNNNFDTVNSAVTSNQGTIGSLQTDVSHLQAMDIQLESNITFLLSGLVDAHTRITDLNGTNIALKLADLNDGVATLETNVDAMDTSVVALANSIDGVNVSLRLLQYTVSRLNVTSNRLSIDALEVGVAADREAIAGLVANDSLLLAAVSAAGDTLESLRGNLTQNVTIAQLFDDVGTLGTTLQTHEQALTAARANITANRHELGDLNNVVSNHSSQIAWLVENVTTQDTKISRLDTHFFNHVTSAQSNIDNLTDTLLEQQSIIEKQAFTISVLNTTAQQQEERIEHLESSLDGQQQIIDNQTAMNVRQQQQIERLESSLDAFNTTLSAAMVAMEQMSQATTFAGVVETTTSLIDCGGGDDQPCATTVDAETADRGPAATIQACYFYPCSDAEALQTISWGRELIVVGDIDADAVEYTFTLESDGIVWEAAGEQAATSFVPRKVRGLSSERLYTLRVAITLEDGSQSEATLEGLQFAAPPQLHGIDVDLINASAAVNWFDVTVNASDVSPLTYDYWIADTDGVWSYIFESNASASIQIAVHSTRDVVLEVVVNNAHLSSTTCNTSCPLLDVESSGLSSPEIWQQASQLLDDSEQVVAAFISGIDSASDASDMQDLFDVFVGMVHDNVTTASHSILILHEFQQAGVPSGLLNAIELVGERLSDATDHMLELYLGTVDHYGSSASSAASALNNIADLDTYLSSVCVTLEAGSLPNSEVSTIEEDTFSLSCTSAETVVNIRTEMASLTTSVELLSTATVSHWSTTINSTDDTSLLSSVHGFHIDSDSDEEAEEVVDVADATAVAIAVPKHTESARKAVSCKYFDETNSAWSDRGVVLMGLSLDDSRVLHVICSSSHFTLFGVGDDSEAAKVLETKLSSFAGRVSQLNAVNYADPNAAINMSLLAMVGGVSLLFILTITIAKVLGRKAAVERAALVFEQEGQLSKPNTIGSHEYEAILRRWVTGAQTVKLLVLEVLTSNAVLGLLFHWDHEAIVFGRADKVMLLFGAILMTFVSSAFLFDPHEESSDDFLVALWASLVAAMLTNALLLPVQHFLPYMVSNVNSVSSFTPTPVPLLKREMRRLSCWKPPPRKRPEQEVVARALTHWIGLVLPAPATATADMLASEPIASVSTNLHFLCCRVKIPSRNQEAGTDWKLPALEPNETTRLVTFQRRVRQTMKDYRSTRSFEFRAWYKGCRTDRHVLATLSVAVMMVVTAFTLWICFLLSGAFSETESLLWMEDVGKSLALQVFVTDPVFTLLVIFTKLLVSWVLLQTGKKRRKRELAAESQHVEKSMSKLSRKLNVAVGKATALKFVCDNGRANAEAIDEQVVQHTAAKKQCEIVLDGILAAKQRLLALRRAAARPSAPELTEWGLQQTDLDERELRTRNALAALEAMLEVLRGTDSASEEELRRAEEMVLNLQHQLGRMSKKKGDLAAKTMLLDDQLVESIKKTGLSPAAHVVVVEEPAIERLGMRHSLSPTTSVSHAPTLSVPRSRSSVVPVVRKGARKGRRGRNIKPAAGSMSSSLRRQRTEVASLVPKVKPGASRMRRKMTWVEIRQLQAQLKAKAGEQAASTARRRSSGRLSPAAIKVILDRRERRRKMLEAKKLTASDKTRRSGKKSPVVRSVADL